MFPKGKNFRVGTGTWTGTVEIKCWNPEPRQNYRILRETAFSDAGYVEEFDPYCGIYWTS
jgi:hypothetical protein